MKAEEVFDYGAVAKDLKEIFPEVKKRLEAEVNKHYKVDSLLIATLEDRPPRIRFGVNSALGMDYKALSTLSNFIMENDSLIVIINRIGEEHNLRVFNGTNSQGYVEVRPKQKEVKSSFEGSHQKMVLLYDRTGFTLKPDYRNYNRRKR